MRLRDEEFVRLEEVNYFNKDVIGGWQICFGVFRSLLLIRSFFIDFQYSS